MSDKQRRRVIILGLLLVVIFLAKSVWGVWQKSQVAKGARDEAMTQRQELQERRDALSARVSALETPRGEEAELRRNFPVVKEGEKVIMIVDEPATTSTTTSDSWWDRIFKSFGN